MLYCMTYYSPLGNILLTEDNELLVGVEFDREPRHPLADTPLLRAAAAQLDQFFSRRRQRFSLPLDPRGTEFQRRCWSHLLDVNYGYTCSYGQLAAAMGRPKAARAVGQAVHNNPVAIIIPCHRVLGHDGSLTGFGGGLWRKEFLLELERG